MVIHNTRQWLDIHGYRAEIIVGSIRSPENIVDWANTGAHILTIPPEPLIKSQLCAMTMATVEQFMDDAEKTEKSLDALLVS